MPPITVYRPPFYAGIEQTKLRERLLDGLWREDLVAALQRQLGNLRAEVTGNPDPSRNMATRIADTYGANYRPSPVIKGLPDDIVSLVGDYSSPLVIEWLEQQDMGRPLPSTLARLLAHNQRYWLVCNSSGVYVGWANGRPVVRVVKSSYLRGIEDASRPGTPSVLGMRRYRKIGPNVVETWSVWDLRDAAPTYRVYRGSMDTDEFAELADDVTTEVGDTPYSGDAYLRQWSMGGEPYIPVEVYHRHVPTIDLFDRDTGSELSQGALTVAVLWSFWLHCVRDASWPGRNIMGMMPGSGVTKGNSKVMEIPDDPTIVHRWLPDKSSPVAPMHWQWEPGADPHRLYQAIQSYEKALELNWLGVDYSSTGGDPLRVEEARRRQTLDDQSMVCREHDARVVGMIIAQTNRERGTSHSTDGHQLYYGDEVPLIPSRLRRASDGTLYEEQPNVRESEHGDPAGH